METDKDLSKYRLEQAEECLSEAKLLLAGEKYKGATNRSYYCVFNSMRSVLSLENVDFKKHSAVIGYFTKNYIHTDKFDKRLSKIITDLFELRGKSDYDAFYVIAKQDVAEQIQNAEYFLGQVKAYLQIIDR